MRTDRAFFGVFGLYLLACSIGTLVYLWIGREWITASYEAESGGYLSHSLRFRDARSLEYYFRRAVTVITGFWLFAAVLPLVYYPAKKGHWLGALLIADFAFILLSGFAQGPFNIDSDWSLPELFQYGKEFSVIMLLLAVYRIWGYRSLRSLVYVFTFFLVDDSLQYHERMGAFLSGAFLSGALIPNPDGSATRQNIGEALSLVVPAIVLGLLVLNSYLRDEAMGRRILRDFLILIGLFAFFGVFVDLVLKSMVSASLEPNLTIVEDGGEMVVMSLFVFYSVHLYRVAAGLPQLKEVTFFSRVLRSAKRAEIEAA